MRGTRKVRLAVLGGVVVAVGVAVAVVATLHNPNHYQSFRRSCASQSGAVVTLAVTDRLVTMGAPIKEYKMGCRLPNGTVAATMITNNP
jgi:Flp pilus assembly protein CpaB